MAKYVIHKHHARNLHYDLRLEIDNVLKSWALPKEPPGDAGVKRLAVSVEDHPLSYASFEGEIPEGSYGAGKVEIWDSGSFELEQRGEDKMVVAIEGRRLRGRYALIRLKPNQKQNYIFFKIK